MRRVKYFIIRLMCKNFLLSFPLIKWCTLNCKLVLRSNLIQYTPEHEPSQEDERLFSSKLEVGPHEIIIDAIEIIDHYFLKMKLCRMELNGCCSKMWKNCILKIQLKAIIWFVILGYKSTARTTFKIWEMSMKMMLFQPIYIWNMVKITLFTFYSKRHNTYDRA